MSVHRGLFLSKGDSGLTFLSGVSQVGLPPWGSAPSLFLQAGKGQPLRPETPGCPQREAHKPLRQRLAGERAGGFKFKESG